MSDAKIFVAARSQRVFLHLSESPCVIMNLSEHEARELASSLIAASQQLNDTVKKVQS